MRFAEGGDARRRGAAGLLVALLLACVVAVVVHGPIPQDPGYHAFADGRPWLGVQNAANVLSNAPILLVGLLALRAALSSRRRPPGTPAWATLALGTYGLGLALTALGSAWYHHDPTDASLVWDRAPMTIAISAFLGLVLGERLGSRVGRAAWVPLVVAGLLSVVAWNATLTDAPGGDLRAYVVAKFFPPLAIVALLLATPEPRETRALLVWTLVGFAVATAFERADLAIYRATGGFVSGHTMKHLAAAGAAALPLLWFETKRPAAGSPRRAESARSAVS